VKVTDHFSSSLENVIKSAIAFGNANFCKMSSEFTALQRGQPSDILLPLQNSSLNLRVNS
jgi:hypothetical protein